MRVLRGFRTRLVVTVIALVAVTASVLALSSYALVRRSLRAQVRNDAVAQAEFNIGVLASPEVLPLGSGRDQFEGTGLARRFSLRGSSGIFVDFGDGEPFASSLLLVDTPQLVTSELLGFVESGDLGWQYLDVAGEPSLVVAGRRPPDGPDFYFFFSTAEVDDALGRLRRILSGVALGVVVTGALAAGLVARGVLRPVRTAGAAAERVAGGDLSVRIPVESSDAFGKWAEAFNRMAGSLDQKIAELEAAHARERRFVADVSHELRTPLTGIVNEAAMLRTHLDAMPEQGRRVGELLVADVGRLRRLVNDLLEISRLEAGPTDIDASVTEVRRFLEAVIAERHPAATLTVTDLDDPVSTDRRALERIVGNLLDNSRVHADGAAVRVEAAMADENLVVTVADDGPGIPEDAVPHLFDRFYKADAARPGGSGLGLAIARQYARRLGGDVTARPVATGAVFELRIPVTEPLPDRDGGVNRVPQAEGGSAHAD